MEGDRRLVLHALAARARPDGQDAQLVRAAAADPGVGAGAAEQLVGAVLVDREQAGLRVEGLCARAVGVLEEDRAVGEGERAGVGRLVLVIDCRGGEDAAGDDAAGRAGASSRHHLEVLGAGAGRPGGLAGAGRGQARGGHRPRNRDHAHPCEDLASELHNCFSCLRGITALDP